MNADCYQAAKALVLRGTTEGREGWHWTFDKRLRCISLTLPGEDELGEMFHAIEAPVCLVRASSGVSYPAEVFQGRVQAFRNLTVHEVPGGHHVHMDNPVPEARIIAQFIEVDHCV